METLVPEGYQETRLGFVPINWKIYKLSNVLKLYVEPLEMKNDEQYELITVRRTGNIDSRGTYFGKEILVKTQFYIREKNFVISKRQVSHGAFGLVPKKLDGAIVSNEYNVLRTDDEKVDTNFLHYYSRHPKFWQSFYNYSDGVHIEKLLFKTKSWLKLKFPFPSMKEQIKIAQILTTWDEAIVKQEKLIKEKEKLKKGLMQKLLSGEVRFDGFSDEWQEIKLGEVFTERTSRAGEEEHELLAVTMANGVVKRDEVDIKDSSSNDKSNYKQVKINDIAYNTMRMWQGASGVSKYNGIVSPAYTIVYLKKDYDIDFFGYLFKTHRVVFDFYRYSQGLTSDTWNIKYPHFSEVKVKIPSNKEEQSKIVKVLKKLEEEINLLKNELEELKLQKKALMQKLLTGQVRVKV